MQRFSIDCFVNFMISFVFFSIVQTSKIFADIDALNLSSRNRCYEAWMECNKITNPQTCSLGIYDTAKNLPHHRNELAEIKSTLELALAELKSKEKTMILLTLSSDPHSDLSKIRLAIRDINNTLRLIETTDNFLVDSIEAARLILYTQHLETDIKNYVLTLPPIVRKIVEVGKIYEHTTEPRDRDGPTFHLFELLNLVSSGAIMQLKLKLWSNNSNTEEGTIMISSSSNNHKFSVPSYFAIYTKDNSTDVLNESELVAKLKSILRENSTDSKPAYFQVSVERPSATDPIVWQ